MDIVNYLLRFIVGLVNKLLPIFNLPTSMVESIDSAFTVIIDIINLAAYFLPVNTMVTCLSAILIFDNWKLIFRIGQWIIKLIRG